MRLLDLFCGAGGAAMGYHQAGEHGQTDDCDAQTHGLGRYCPGGSRTVLDGIPDEWVQRGAVAAADYTYGDIHPSHREQVKPLVRAVLEAVLHDPGVT